MPATKRKRRPSPTPFHPVAVYINSVFKGYAIYVNNRPFLTMVDMTDKDVVPLKRHDAYAIARLLNAATSSRKWAARYPDPYVEVSA